MTSSAFENPCGAGKPLRAEPADAREFAGLVRSAKARLDDAGRKGLSRESRFDLAYNAAHALCLAALRWHGYRSSNRAIVFRLLPHTLGLGPEVWRLLSKCHDQRNIAEYGGHFDDRLVADLIDTCRQVLLKVEKLPTLA